MGIIQWILCLSLTPNIILLFKLISLHKIITETEQRANNLQESVLQLSIEYYEALKYINECDNNEKHD